MSSESRRRQVLGLTNGYANDRTIKSTTESMKCLNSDLEAAAKKYQATFHGDNLLGDKQVVLTGTLLDIRDIFIWRNAKQIWNVVSKWFAGQGLDVSAMPFKAYHGFGGLHIQWD